MCFNPAAGVLQALARDWLNYIEPFSLSGRSKGISIRQQRPTVRCFYLLRAQVLEVSRFCSSRNPERALTQVTERLAHRESLGGKAWTIQIRVMPLVHWPGALLTRGRRVPQSVLQRVRQNLDLAHAAFNYIARLRGS